MAAAETASAQRPVCPISLEAIPDGAAFDLGCGTPFDIRSVLDLVLVQGAAAAHPYTRELLGADTLRRVYAAAMEHPETRAALTGRGLADEVSYAQHLRRAALGARAELDQQSLGQMLDTAWASFIDRAAAEGRVVASDLLDMVDLAMRVHRSPAAARRHLFSRIEARYESSANVDELANLAGLTNVLNDTFTRVALSDEAPSGGPGSFIRTLMGVMRGPILGSVIERAPPMHVPGGSEPAGDAAAAAAPPHSAGSRTEANILEDIIAALDDIAGELEHVRVQHHDSGAGERGPVRTPRIADSEAGTLAASETAAVVQIVVPGVAIPQPTTGAASGSATSAASGSATGAASGSATGAASGSATGAATGSTSDTELPPRPLIDSPRVVPRPASAATLWLITISNVLLGADYRTLPERALAFLQGRLRREAAAAVADFSNRDEARQALLEFVRHGEEVVRAELGYDGPPPNAALLREAIELATAAPSEPAAGAGAGEIPDVTPGAPQSSEPRTA